MRFMLVMYADGTQYPAAGTDEGAALHAEWMTYTQAMIDAGIREAGAALLPTSMAQTVRGTDLLVTDGPFAETKEQLGGYYVIDVADADEAMVWAKQAPHLAFGSVEVRPVLEFPDEP